jgi:hypothetical protein
MSRRHPAIAFVIVLNLLGCSHHRPEDQSDTPNVPLNCPGKWGCIDSEGTVVIPCTFDWIGEFSEGLAPFKKSDKFGFIDGKGKVVITPQYEYAVPFSEGLASVRIESRWGYIDREGNWKIKPSFSGAWQFSEGFARISTSDGYSFIDMEGRFISTARYSWVGTFSDGMARVFQVKEIARGSILSYGYIDKTGSEVIPLIFRYARSFSQGYAQVYLTGQDWAIINKKGEIVFKQCIYEDPSTRFFASDIEHPDTKKYHSHIEANWKQESDVNSIFSGGLLRFMYWPKDSSHVMKGFVDSKGNVKIKPQFADAQRFSEGLAGVQQNRNGLFGFIDDSGNLVIPYQFLWVEHFHEGRALVQLTSGGNVFIDRTGKIVSPKLGECVGTRFSSGLAPVMLGQ